MIKSLLLAALVIAHDPGYFTSLANHIRRWLGEERVAAKVVTPKDAAAALKNEKIAFLVGYDDPTAAELQTLKSFHDRGGKLVVFHSSSPKLAEMMGVKVVGYRTAPYAGAWSRMDFAEPRIAGFPARITQTSTVLQAARPANAQGRVLATWSDRLGRTQNEPAWIGTPAGFWMTHVLLADGDENLKARLCAAMCAVADPRSWSLKDHQARAKEFRTQAIAMARAGRPRRGEIHAVWDHSGCGLYPGNWAKTFRVLKDARVTDLFVNVAGAGFAHYPSSVLPRSKIFEQEGDQLAACLAAAKDTGVRVHAWVLTFTGTRASPARLEEFARKGWRLRNKSGALTEYLDPSRPAVRRLLLDAVDELQRMYPRLQGVHLDFVRWYEGAVKPADATAIINDFVADVRRHVRRPRWLTAAVLGKYPSCIASVGQDWESWLDMGLVDYVVPMDYTADLDRFDGYLSQHAANRKHAERTIVGIGVTANESRLDAIGVMREIEHARRYPFAGTALFDLDVTLEKSILPYLQLGTW